VQLRKRGVLTLPKSLRETHDMKEGDPLHLVDVGGGTVVMTPMQPMVPELAEEIAAIRQAEGLSMDAVLQGLREQREQLTRERYGAPQNKSADKDSS
jgi:bifunctional DNA-binding transcriptional regulator/antitoxin component of YhaV-PrlF toxin-antitoxin module